MKQNLLNKLWLRVCMIAVVMTTALAGTALADTKTFDFRFETMGDEGWTSSYTSHTTEYTEGKVVFASADKNTGTITTMPVTKGQPVEFIMAEGYTMSAITFNCKQWGTKAQTITLHYSTNGGTTYTSTGITSDNFTITSDELPTGTNAAKITFSSTANQVGIESATITYTYSGGGGDSSVATSIVIDDSNITNTDVYAGTDAGSLAATVVAGETTVDNATVTWSGNNDAVATIDETTGAVTLVGAGTVTFTATYAGAVGEYKASTATYEMTVTDSTPFVGGDVTFVCGTDASETTSITKSGVTMTMTSGVWNRTDNYRLYANQSITISTTSGTITSIVFVVTQNNFAGDGYDATTYTWTGSAKNVTLAADGGQVRFTSVSVTVNAGGTPDPLISADDVTIAYDATSGSITYTLENEVNGGVLSAVVTSPEGWLTLGTPANGSVPFTCSANTGEARTATVTLTYAYDNQSVTKDVTVTQEANANIVNNISDITAAGTYTVQGTIVAKSQRGFIVGDGTGYVYYYNTSYAQDDYNIGDKVKLAGSVVVYGGVFEFNNSTTVTPANESNYAEEEPVVLSGADMDARVASTTPAQLSTYVQYEGKLTVDGTHYNITGIDGATTAKGSISYPLNTDFIALDGKTVKVKGYYVGISSSLYYNTLIGSIEEVVTLEPSIELGDNVINAFAQGTDGVIIVDYKNITTVVADVFFCDADGKAATYDWIDASINSINNLVYIIDANASEEPRTAYMKVHAHDDNANDVYSELITINQEGYVAPVAEFATLPFSFDGGKADIETTAGLTQEGLDSDYNNSPKLKFNSTGDYVILAFDERPGKLTFDIKGNSFSDGTFSVQTSEDGVTYTDLETYTELGATQSAEFNNLGENVRYIKWIYTEKVTGNVALGNIALAQYAAIVLNDYTLAVANPDNVTITATYNEEVLQNGESAAVTEGTEVTVVVAPAQGYVFQSLTIAGEEEGQTVTPNETAVEGIYTFSMPSFNVTINATVVEYVEPVVSTYVLATSITSGKSYVIASGAEEGTVQVMAEQKTNNRGAVDATIASGVLKVSDEYEFVIESASTEDASGYSIFDPDAKGYLYAAGSDKNYLKTQTDNNDNGIWTITFEADGSASIIAEKSTNRNVMQYNSGSNLFSCYSSASQAPVYLFEKVETPAQVQTVAVTAVGYATMVAESDLDIPAGVEVYAVQVNGNYAVLNPVTAGVPAGEAVVVKAEAGDYSFTYATSSVPALTGNDLTAATAPVTANGTQFVLAQPAGEAVGFYRATVGSTIAAGKAYLEITNAGVKGFTFIFGEDDPTGIENPNTLNTQNTQIYNLAGQRISKMQRGINIVNGKKVMVK